MPLKADTITKDYVKSASVFADIFNYYIYGGRQVILPEQLTERDSTKIALPYGADGAVVPVQIFREVERRAADVIEAITNSGIKYDESEEVVNVCQAIQEIRMEERKIGELNKAKEDAVNFYKLGVEIEKIAQGVGYAVETVKEWLGLSDDTK